MDDFIVRQAKLEDLDILLGFEQGIIHAERPFDPTLAEDPINYYDLKAFIASSDVEVVVVCFENEIIGSGYARVKRALPYLDHEVYAYLGFMYTRPEFRGMGVNKLVVNALRDWASTKGLKEIRLTVYDENQAALRAYGKVGFKKHIIEMRLE